MTLKLWCDRARMGLKNNRKISYDRYFRFHWPLNVKERRQGKQPCHAHHSILLLTASHPKYLPCVSIWLLYKLKRNEIVSFASRNVDYIFSTLTKKNWLINTDLFTSKGNYKLKRLLSFYPDALASGIGAVSLIEDEKV